jgi:hypothetical protein
VSVARPHVLRVPAGYYQQFDADFASDVPAEGYGGWRRATLDLSLDHTAVVVMHAWDTGTREAYPGWHRAVEYIPRADEIVRGVFPRLLGAVRASPLPLFHVVGGGDYYRDLPGHRRALALAGPSPAAPPQIVPDATLEALRRFRAERVFPGAANREDVRRGVAVMGFPAGAEPRDDEGIAADGHQLAALCAAHGVNHLIYAGFAINWCLLLSPGGMAEMSRRGVLCSAFRQAVTAVENRETARGEWGKENALWRVALAFGFVFDVGEFVDALARRAGPEPRT